MKKKINKGYVLVETLIVTTFVAGVLVYLFIQYTNLNQNYNLLNTYNTVDDLFALEDVRDYIISDETIKKNIKSNLEDGQYINLTDCQLFTSESYCLKLFELENINYVIVVKGILNVKNFSSNDEELKTFISKMNTKSEENYRLIAKFNNKTFATISFEV